MNHLSKRIKKLESIVNVKKIDWDHYMKHPNELTSKMVEVMKDDRPDLFDKLLEMVYLECWKNI